MPQTLYLKYRPKDFDSVVGQEIARITLKNAAKAGKLSHAYLFTGPRGTGKTSMARIVAKAINCTNLKEDGNPCNQCTVCTSISEGRNVDMIEIDAASHTGVDDVRDLIDKARFMPNESKKKVYIIDEVHMLSKSAFNALLKTLEEPPEHVHFILATTESHKVPETIISRCQKFDFKRIESKDIVYQLKYIAEQEGIAADVKALNLLAKMAEGGLRNAIGLLEQTAVNKALVYDEVVDALDVTGMHVVEGLFADLEEKRVQQALEKINDLYEGGGSLGQFLKDLIEYVREKMLEAVRNEDASLVNELLRWIELLEKANNDLKVALIPQLPLEIAVTRICLGTIEGAEDTGKKPDKPTEKEKGTSAQPAKMEKKEPSPAPEKKVAAPQTTTKKDLALSLAALQTEWQNLCEQLPPKLKHAYKNCAPTALEENKVTLTTASQTYLEMVASSAAATAMEKILSEAFGQQLVTHVVLSKEPTEKISDTALGKKLSAEEAAALLGGNIVEG